MLFATWLSNLHLAYKNVWTTASGIRGTEHPSLPVSPPAVTFTYCSFHTSHLIHFSLDVSQHMRRTNVIPEFPDTFCHRAQYSNVYIWNVLQSLIMRKSWLAAWEVAGRVGHFWWGLFSAFWLLWGEQCSTLGFSLQRFNFIFDFKARSSSAGGLWNHQLHPVLTSVVLVGIESQWQCWPA